MIRSLLTLTSVPLELDPRALRAVEVARGEGLEIVAVSGSARSGSGASSRLARIRRGGPLLREVRGAVRILRLARMTVKLVREGRSRRSAIVHAHDLDTLPAGWLLARRWSSRLVYDAHELYSGFESDPPRLWAAVSLVLERFLARKAAAVVTVSEPIARELVERLGLDRRPEVVLNCPRLVEIPTQEPGEGKPLRAIYQAAAGPGRHLEDLAVAASQSPSVEITARVLGRGAENLEGVRTAAPVRPAEMVTALAGYSVGIVLDRPLTPNARLALPNKLFEYLMGGLAVAVPRGEAMAELVEAEAVGVVYEPGELGTTLERLAGDREALASMRRRARRLALDRLNAEAQRPALLRAWGL